jgi:peptide/nickel transport system substrate-binding protein
MTVSNNWTKDVAQVLVQQWAEAGIRAKVEVLPSPEWKQGVEHRQVRLRRLVPPPARRHVPRARLPHRRAVERIRLFQRRVRPRARPRRVDRPTSRSAREHVRRLEEILQNDGPLVQPLFRSVYTFCDKRMKGFEMHPTQYVECNRYWLAA